jgi:hypothetical protein
MTPRDFANLTEFFLIFGIFGAYCMFIVGYAIWTGDGVPAAWNAMP